MRAKHRSVARQGLVLGSIIVGMLAVGQAGTVFAGAAPPVDSPDPSSVDDVQPVIPVTPSSSAGDASAIEITEQLPVEISDQLPPEVTEQLPEEATSVDPEAGCAEEVDLVTCVSDETDAGASIPTHAAEAVDEPTPPDLQVSKTSDADGILHDGDDLVYTITVTNMGDETATGVEVVDILSPGAQGVAFPPFPTLAGKACTVTSSVLPGGVPHAEVRCGPVSLDPGESATVTVRVIVDGTFCGAITNVVDVEGRNEPAANVRDDNHAEATDEVACVPRIRLSKEGPSFAHAGDAITYLFTVRNNGGVDLTNIELSDPKCDSSPTLFDDGNGNTSLAVGERWTFECDHTVTSSDGNVIHNVATVTGDHEGGTVTDRDTHEVDVIHPSIDLEKTATPSSGPTGTFIVYTYAVTNTGDTPLSDVSVTDDKLGNVGVIATLAAGATHELTSQITLGSSPITNVATATGEDRLGRSVDDTDSASVTVVAGTGGGTGGDGSGGGSPFTGSDTDALAAWMVILTAVGSVLLVTSRKRSRPHAECA
ncbi:MAG: DUF11 domain-containing protein [Actinobacteria bacterium]|nr:DUF11 domain-containing protein [Actinomycetota bacterium]